MTLDGLTVDGVLGPEGALSAALPGYEHRPTQLMMARAVAEALEGGHHLMAEAGTGTGKSLAYLVPAVLSGKRVIISTATRTLQEQLFTKTVPLLRDVVGVPFNAIMLQGRANYLCAHRFEAFDAQPLFATPEGAKLWPSVRAWAFSTDTGERGETTAPETWEGWPRITTTPEGCLGGGCQFYERCFVTRARRAAETCQIIIVNHALFFADVALRSRNKELGLRILPSADAVIFDEAHALEDVATDHFGFSLTWTRLANLADEALELAAPASAQATMLSGLALELRAKATSFYDAVASRLGTGEGRDWRLDETLAAMIRPEGVVLLEAIAALGAGCSEGEEDNDDAANLKRRADELGAGLERLLACDDATQVHWAQTRGDGGRKLVLRSAPIEVGAALKAHLYGDLGAAIFTSATLAVGQTAHAFDYVLQRFGLESSNTKVLRVESPFDYQRQSALYVPRHLPEPNQPGWTDAFAEEVKALLGMSAGRAFVLFTSLRHLDAVHALVAPTLDVPVLKQGEAPRRALLERFIGQPSVLFASQSFWEGVDVPGDALSMVIIDRLPFAPPNDPLEAARIDAVRQRGQRPFDELQVPQAALALRQGFGRLIRTATDRGVVALGDTRLLTKSYGKVFLASLPKSQRFSRRPDLERWWAQTARG